MNKNRNLILYISMSLDGYIAKPDGDISFLSLVEKEEMEYGYSRFLESVDTIILGRKTYDKILTMGIEWPDGSGEVYVLTRSTKPDSGNLHFYSGNVTDLISNLRSQEGKHIYCDGGAETVHQLLMEDLLDEISISIIPVMLRGELHCFEGAFRRKSSGL